MDSGPLSHSLTSSSDEADRLQRPLTFDPTVNWQNEAFPVLWEEKLTVGIQLDGLGPERSGFWPQRKLNWSVLKWGRFRGAAVLWFALPGKWFKAPGGAEEKGVFYYYRRRRVWTSRDALQGQADACRVILALLTGRRNHGGGSKKCLVFKAESG